MLHATLLRLYEWLKELILRNASGCQQWGSGRLPEVYYNWKYYCYFFVQGAKERMAETKQRLLELLGPVLGLVEKQAPNQVTGNTCLVIHEK